jgi:hypothetical protein
MIRPLYRWKSVWLGLFVLVFFGWAWARSMDRMDYVSWRQIFVKQAAGELTMIWYEGSDELEWGSAPIPNLNWRNFDLPGTFSTNELYDYDSFSGARVDYGRDYIVSFWFLILFFAVPWSSWLAWRWRRLKRLQTKVSP